MMSCCLRAQCVFCEVLQIRSDGLRNPHIFWCSDRRSAIPVGHRFTAHRGMNVQCSLSGM